MTRRGRILLLLSVALNVALAIWIYRAGQPSPAPEPPPRVVELGPSVSSNVIRTNLIVRRRNFVWSDVESEDYPTYIANLRYIGCPEDTIRDIIVAEVNQLYARRRATEVITADQQWWRSNPDPRVTTEAVTQIQALDQERRTLLTRLLGPDWESADYPMPDLSTLAPLDGPILGTLPPETRLAILQIERDALEQQRAYEAEQIAANQEVDPAHLARLRLEVRARLAEAMPPEAFEEYLLRHSAEAQALRSELRGMNATPEEFRSLFQSLDRIDQEIKQLHAYSSSDAAQKLAELETQRTAALISVLGDARFQDYQAVQNPLFQEAMDVVALAGVSEELVTPLTTIYELTAEQQQLIDNDPDLTPEDRDLQLQEMQSAFENSLMQLLGPEGFERYRQGPSKVQP